VNEQTMYDILLNLPKTRSNMVIIEKPDSVSEKIREFKIKLLSIPTLDKKIAILVNYVRTKLRPNERITFLNLLEQSLQRDLLLSGLSAFAGFILLKGGLSKEVSDASKLFRAICITTGIANLTFSGKVISDCITLLDVISDLKRRR